MNESDYDIKLQELYEKSTERLLTSEVFSINDYIALINYVKYKLTLVKSEYVLSKQLLYSILSSINLLKNRKQFINEISENEYIIKELELNMQYLVYSIDPDDRKPGVPRVI